MSEARTATASESSEPAESALAVQVRGLNKVYDDGLIRALNGVDLDIRHGEMVSITGPSGCGKSTLLHLLAALDVPTSGTIRVEGHDLLRLDHPNRYRGRSWASCFNFTICCPGSLCSATSRSP